MPKQRSGHSRTENVIQAEEYVPHPNDNEYYEDSEYDDDDIPLTSKEWRIDFETRNAEATKRMRGSLIATMEERQAELRKCFNRGVKLMQTHFDRSRQGERRPLTRTR